MTEKTIITPSGQKIIQRTIQRPYGQSEGKSPVTILNKKLAQVYKLNSLIEIQNRFQELYNFFFYLNVVIYCRI